MISETGAQVASQLWLEFASALCLREGWTYLYSRTVTVYDGAFNQILGGCMCDSDALARFDAVARKELEPYFDAIGDVIYSACSTLAKNDVIFWGFNPGGDPAIRDPVGLEPPVQMPLKDALGEFLKRTKSMLDVAWPDNRHGERGVDRIENEPPYTGRYRYAYCPGEAPYQSRTCYLLRKVGHTDAIVSNFLFLQTLEAGHIKASLADVIRDFCHSTCKASRGAAEDEFQEVLKACWRIHMEIFAIAKPKALIVASKKILPLIREYGLLENCTVPTDQCKAGHGDQDCYEYKASFRDCDHELLGHGSQKGITIIEVPHMSRWAIDIPNVDRQRAVDCVVEHVKRAIDEN